MPKLSMNAKKKMFLIARLDGAIQLLNLGVELSKYPLNVLSVFLILTGRGDQRPLHERFGTQLNLFDDKNNLTGLVNNAHYLVNITMILRGE